MHVMRNTLYTLSLNLPNTFKNHASFAIVHKWCPENRNPGYLLGTIQCICNHIFVQETMQKLFSYLIRSAILLGIQLARLCLGWMKARLKSLHITQQPSNVCQNMHSLYLIHISAWVLGWVSNELIIYDRHGAINIRTAQDTTQSCNFHRHEHLHKHKYPLMWWMEVDEHSDLTTKPNRLHMTMAIEHLSYIMIVTNEHTILNKYAYHAGQGASIARLLHFYKCQKEIYQYFRVKPTNITPWWWQPLTVWISCRTQIYCKIKYAPGPRNLWPKASESINVIFGDEALHSCYMFDTIHVMCGRRSSLCNKMRVMNEWCTWATQQHWTIGLVLPVLSNHSWQAGHNGVQRNVIG